MGIILEQIKYSAWQKLYDLQMSLFGYIEAKNVSNFHEDIISKTPPN